MERKVLNNGFVKLVDRMGNDYSIIRAARVSTGNKETTNEKKDKKLIEYLYKNQHFSPFEQVVFTFHIRSPLFVNQQILRHRTFSFNSESARYKKFSWDCYIPDELRIQDVKNKQGSTNKIPEDKLDLYNKEILSHYNTSEEFYNKLLDDGIAREQARTVMPMGHYNEMYFTVDLRNLLHFITLRSHPHAQKEIQEYSNSILDILENLEDLKWTVEIFKKIMYIEHKLTSLINSEGVDEMIEYLNEK
jgi:thymidylate synthase (FAD)